MESRTLTILAAVVAALLLVWYLVPLPGPAPTTTPTATEAPATPAPAPAEAPK
jgi:hypothetical protein